MPQADEVLIYRDDLTDAICYLDRYRGLLGSLIEAGLEENDFHSRDKIGRVVTRLQQTLETKEDTPERPRLLVKRVVRTNCERSGIARPETRPPLPLYGSALAAGLDLAAHVKYNVELKVGELRLIPTGISIALPPGHEGQLRLRSGFATSNKVLMPNAPGTIDADYRGEIYVPVLNVSDKTVWIEPRQRIAQLVVAPVTMVTVCEADELDETPRGEGGYGSTGIVA